MYSREQYMERLKNKEVSIVDVLQYIMGKWKRIALFSLILFVFFATIIFFSQYKNNNKEIEQVSVEQLTYEQKENVNYVLDLYKEIRSIEEYVNESVLMQLNVYNSKVSSIHYYISAKEKEQAEKAYDLYVNFVKNGDFNGDLEKEFEGDIKDLSELVKLEESFSEEETNSEGKRVLPIQIVTSDEEQGTRIVECIKKSITNFQNKVVDKLVGEHELTLFAENSYFKLPRNILEKQNFIDGILMDKKNLLKNTEMSLSDVEKKVVEMKTGSAGEENKDIESKSRIKLPYVLLLIVLCMSFLLVVTYYVFIYLMSNSIKSGNELSDIFGIPIIKWENSKSTVEGRKQMKSEIGLLCKVQGVTSLFISSLTDLVKPEDLEELTSDVKGVNIMTGKNVLNNIEEFVEQNKSIILIVELKKTTYNILEKVFQKCEYLGIKVLAVMITEDLSK